MGDIFAADDTELGRRVAVKLLAERHASDASIRERFTREALAAAKLSGHPHIVTIYDVGEWEGRPFIVMELLTGGSLAERAREGPVPAEQALVWLEQAADALDSAHAESIVHRDVKPANLIFDERGEVHVVDFGIARVLDESTGGVTQTGMVLGTSGYLSPEQASGEGTTPASDVYSLGVVAYELLTGGRPFERSSTTAEAAAHIHEPVPSASARGVGLPRAVDPVFERALAKDPRDRPRSAHEMVDELREVLAETRVAPAPRRHAVARRPSWLVPVGLALLLGAGALAAAIVATGGEDEATRTRPTRTVVETVTTTTAEEEQPVELGAEQAAAQNDRAYSLMNAGRYDDALPLLEEALPSLRGVSPYEAFAEYNLGKTLLELGRCEEALPHLERSERLQGKRPPITAAKRAAERC
jgi:serine/threonine-protein kinase